MAFTNVYDISQPPDTQLANLLGQDIRNLRVDVQQRMSAISGLDAAKPNFAGDTQPSNWNGILFFAKDTGKIYQFNNPAWTDVTANFVPAQTPTFPLRTNNGTLVANPKMVAGAVNSTTNSFGIGTASVNFTGLAVFTSILSIQATLVWNETSGSTPGSAWVSFSSLSSVSFLITGPSNTTVSVGYIVVGN